MNSKQLLYLAIALLVGVALGYALRGGGPTYVGHNLGANVTTSYQSALNQQALYDWQSAAVVDLTSVRSPLSKVYASSSANYAVVTLGPLGATTSTASSTLTFTSASGGPFTVGDIILLGSASSTGINYVPVILTSSTIQVTAVNLSTGGSYTPATTTLYLWDIPLATFKAPSALTVTTTSSP